MSETSTADDRERRPLMSETSTADDQERQPLTTETSTAGRIAKKPQAFYQTLRTIFAQIKTITCRKSKNFIIFAAETAATWRNGTPWGVSRSRTKTKAMTCNCLL